MRSNLTERMFKRLNLSDDEIANIVVAYYDTMDAIESIEKTELQKKIEIEQARAKAKGGK